MRCPSPVVTISRLDMKSFSSNDDRTLHYSRAMREENRQNMGNSAAVVAAQCTERFRHPDRIRTALDNPQEGRKKR